jgi:hypothetical protein
MTDPDPQGKRWVPPIVGLAKGEKGDKGDRGKTGDGMTAGARRGFVYLAVLVLIFSAFNILFTSILVGRVNARTHALCHFDADLGAAPASAAAKPKPSKLAISIISDARVAWHQTGCTGTLPPADSGFVHWAKVYHLPVN